MAQLRTTVKDIARHAGVSPATVSLVLRKSPLVAERTRARIQTSVDLLGYVYDRAAANLRSRLTHTIGLIVCEITNPFYGELTGDIDDALDRAGWVAFLANTAESPIRQDRFIERMREHRVDGFLIAPAEGSDPGLIERLQRQNIPVVQMLRRLGARKADHVGADFRLGITLAAEHLICLGHKRIAFVGGGRTASPARDRAIAYRNTLSRYNLQKGPIVNCPPTREDGARAIRELIRGRSSDPTAILCFNDICAFGVMLGLADRSLRRSNRSRATNDP
jgi:LacI family transcriptional regulator